jgi:EAL domain-containing protein (putative c-di-GMP-specific phosphodiesterase class I)
LQTWQFDSVETIIRWDHPDSGDIPIQRFKPIAEENGLMSEISNWALTNACSQLSQWIYESPSDSPRRVSLDISRKELLHPRFLELAMETIQQSRLRADRVQFEISESEITLDSNGALDVMRKLREVGVRIVIDEFGTSFPSFHYMEQFPVDGIKLNRMLIKDIETNSYMPKLLEMIMRQAAELSLTVVVDGVERETQAKSLNNLGYRWAQGDLFCTPIAGDAMMPFLVNWNVNLRNKSRSKPSSRDNTSGTLAS